MGATPAEGTAVHVQLLEIVAEFDRATARLRTLAAAVPAAGWGRRVDPARWSVGECVEHLNLTGRAFVPVLRAALDDARRDGSPAPARYRRDPLGWLLWRTMGPPVRVRTKTPAAFVPGAQAPPDALVAEFERLQAEQVACVRDADGLPIQRAWVRSPFEARARYNLFSALSIIPRHQHRHLWQAERQFGTAGRA